MATTSIKAPPAATEPAADPFIGKTVGNCQILEKINEGGTAYIYRAHNTRFGLDRVIKVLKPSLSGEEDFYQRFVQEAQLTARLDHPNILRVFDTGEVDGYFYIEMEYITGQTLRGYLQSTPRIAEREILSIASQVVKALDYAHHVEIAAPGGATIRGLLHRDLKPENIMLTPGKLVKLMDFGAAKPLNITSNTMQGMIVGTFHYMSPEQLKGDKLDMRSDFFSLGIVLYELCTGQKPFSAENLTELIQKITACRFTPVRDLRPSITPMTAEIVDRLLCKKPDHRPHAAREIDETLQIAVQSLNAWSVGQRVRVPFSWKRALPAVSLVISLCALGVALLALFTGGPRVALRGGERAGVAASTASPLDKGKELEGRGSWREAMAMYEMVAPPKEGGLANEYLEAQIRLAYLSYRRQQQLTRARSILETLRNTFSDPAIDAYLGQIYYAQALYLEARLRFESALGSSKGSVIPQTEQFRGETLYFLACALDKQYTFVDRSPAIRLDAIKAWKYYMEFAGCKAEKTKECAFAVKRLAELEKQENAGG